MVWLTGSVNRIDEHFFDKVLPAIWQGLDVSNHIHAFGNPAKGSKTSTIRISVATIIKRWLIAHTDEYFSGGTSWLHPGHGDYPVGVLDACDICGFVFYGRVGLNQFVVKQSPLNYFYLHRAVWLVIGSDNPIKNCPIIGPTLHQG
jgi:hypothetical protein